MSKPTSFTQRFKEPSSSLPRWLSAATVFDLDTSRCSFDTTSVNVWGHYNDSLSGKKATQITYGYRKAKEIITTLQETLQSWPDFASEAGVPKNLVPGIARNFRIFSV